MINAPPAIIPPAPRDDHHPAGEQRGRRRDRQAALKRKSAADCERVLGRDAILDDWSLY